MGVIGRIPTARSTHCGDATHGRCVSYKWGRSARLWIAYDDGSVIVSDETPGARRGIEAGAYAVLYVLNNARPI